MDRIGEISQKVQSISFLKEFLKAIKKSKGIDIELSDQELLTIFNEIMPVEAVNVQSVEIVKAVYISTEERIKEAVEYCKANNIKPTVRSIAKQAGFSIATVSRYGYKHLLHTDAT